MKKLLMILLAVTMVLSTALLFAAGEKEEEAETITVLMGIDAAGKNMGARAEEFTAETGIQVNMIEVEWDTMVNKQSVALTAGEPTYDIVDCGSFMLPEYVPGGMYADISDMFPPEKKAKYMEGMVEAVTIDGKVYAAPLMASWVIMFYNGQMFEEAGLDPNQPPETWEEFIEYGEAIQSEDTYAFADSLGPGEYVTVAFFRWSKSAGADIHTTVDGKVKWELNSPECIEAVDFLKRAMRTGAMDPGSVTYYQQQLADLFGKGHCSMFVNWDMMSIAFRDPEQTPYAGKIHAATMPGKTADLTGSIEGHEYMAVPTASLHKDAAKQFIEYVTSVENVKRRAIEQGMTPVYEELFDDPEVQKELPLDVIFKAAANCYYRPAIAEYSQCSDIISTEVQNVLVNDKDTKQALTDANNKCNALLGW